MYSSSAVVYSTPRRSETLAHRTERSASQAARALSNSSAVMSCGSVTSASVLNCAASSAKAGTIAFVSHLPFPLTIQRRPRDGNAPTAPNECYATNAIAGSRTTRAHGTSPTRSCNTRRRDKASNRATPAAAGVPASAERSQMNGADSTRSTIGRPPMHRATSRRRCMPKSGQPGRDGRGRENDANSLSDSVAPSHDRDRRRHAHPGSVTRADWQPTPLQRTRRSPAAQFRSRPVRPSNRARDATGCCLIAPGAVALRAVLCTVPTSLEGFYAPLELIYLMVQLGRNVPTEPGAPQAS